MLKKARLHEIRDGHAKWSDGRWNQASHYLEQSMNIPKLVDLILASPYYMERPDSVFFKGDALEPFHWQPPYVLLAAYDAYREREAGRA